MKERLKSNILTSSNDYDFRKEGQRIQKTIFVNLNGFIYVVKFFCI